MNNSTINTFFHYVSKYIILVPVVVIVLGLLLKSTQIKPTPTTFVTPTVTPTIMPAKPSPLSLLQESTIAAQLTLKGTFSCQAKKDNENANLYVNNGQAYAELDNERGLLLNDCGYYWDNKTLKGTKMCGVSQIITLIENTPFSSLITNSYVSSFVAGREQEIYDLIQSCQLNKIPNQSFFTIPYNVVFDIK